MIARNHFRCRVSEADVAGQVVAVCISERKGTRKVPVPSITMKSDFGIEGDAHAGNWHRQVSLLAMTSIQKIQTLGLDVDKGDFAENITTEGINLVDLPIGAGLKIGEVILEITQIGKECHSRCAIYHQARDCVMPKEGVFANVISGGEVRSGDIIDHLVI